MIVAKRKPFEEIKEMLKGYKKVLNIGCGTCVSVCLTGGEKEVTVLSTELEMARRLDGDPIEIGQITVERQCDREYLAELDDRVDEYDALILLVTSSPSVRTVSMMVELDSPLLPSRATLMTISWRR